PEQLDQILHPQFDSIAKSKAEVIAIGLPASPGAAVGEVVFDAHKANDLVEQDKRKVILVRTETSPEDLIGMNAAEGILTARGGMTSHAAVVARGMGKCCVAGCNDITVNELSGYFTAGSLKVNEGDTISLDGAEGKIYLGALPTTDADLSGDFSKFMGWADEFRVLRVRANADTPFDAKVAKKFGAEGIGLCRTEHMFFEGDRINMMREMILAPNTDSRKKALAKLLPLQRSDFKGLFDVMDGFPVTIRMLDPPLHEFLPREEADIKNLASELGISVEQLKEKIDSLHETNPMLGHRGCRLAITFPEIAEMQAEAIILAALDVRKEGKTIAPEIMIPLVGSINELSYLKEIVTRVADRVINESEVDLVYSVGTMIEVPRAALTADDIAKEAEFFSFGTNDLTQMALGFSRDDVGKFVPDYIAKNLMEHDPFQVLDQTGVGQLVRMAVEKGKKTRPDIKLGICGEHGGDPQSVGFCHDVGLAYVSCSPYRVPIARLAAAQAAIRANA
ncbi:putative PEP-binding protein, partial [archaeon]